MNSNKICGILIACATLAAFSHAASAQQGSAGQDIKRDAKATGHGIGNGARDIGHATKHVATSIGHGAKEAGLGIGHGAKKAGLGIGHGAREGWDATKQGVKHVFHKGD
ncbi:MAG: hypothetical protein ABI227_00010 [Rhodanobacter sp.]